MMTNSRVIEIDAASIDFSKQVAFGITEAQRDQIISAAKKIQLSDPMTVHDFGRSALDNNYLDTMLENVRLIDQGESGKKFARIVDLSQQISDSLEPTRIQKALSRVPVLGAAVSGMAFMRRKTLRRFDSVKNQMNILSGGIESISHGYMNENAKLEKVYSDVYAEVKELGVNIVAALLVIQSMEETVKELNVRFSKNRNDTLLALEISDKEYLLTVLKKRRADMIANQQKCFDDLTMLRIIQQNNLTMVDKFRTIEDMTLPAAKRGHIIVDALEKQNQSVKLSEAIDDATNGLAVRQAELVKENSVRIARQSHRTVYDESTLIRISKLMNETITEVKAIHQSSANNHILLEKRAAQLQEERRARLVEGMKK